MVQTTQPAARVRRVLLIDAVVWAPTYPTTSPFRDVRQWYARALETLPGIELACVRADDDPLTPVRAGVDGVILSGSPRDAWTDDPVNEVLAAVVHTCRDRGIPFLGVCYGHQLLARALGGRVGRHPQGLELGNTVVTLTGAGRSCRVFAGFEAQFEVLSSHVDAVLELPPGAILTVRGAHTSCQAFSWGTHLFGVQFHPETDPDTLRFLWSVRRDTWRSRVPFDLDAVLDNLRPTPHGVHVLRNFVTRVLP